MGKRKRAAASTVADDVSTFDVDGQRMTHESSTEWRLRRSFLAAHCDKFAADRLVCLSQCFINVQLYGCQYPPAVMHELSALTDDLDDDATAFRTRLQERSAVKFVKASADDDNAGDDVTRACDSNAPVPSKKSKSNESLSKFLKPLSFVKADDNLGAKNTIGDDSDVDAPPTATTSSQRRNELSSMSVDVLLKRAKANSGKLSIFHKISAALQQKMASAEPGNMVSALHEACQKSQVQHDFVECAAAARGQQQQVHGVQLFIDSVFVARAEATSKKNAKRNASQSAVELLTGGAFDIVSANGRAELVAISGGASGGGAPASVRAPASARAPAAQSTLNGTNVTAKLPSLSTASPDVKQKRKKTKAQQAKRAAAAVITEQQTSADQGDEFILFEHYGNRDNAVSVLHTSADYNRKPIEYRTDQVKGKIQSTVVIAGRAVATATAQCGVMTLRAEVSEKALQALRRSNWTLLVKQAVDGDGEQMSKNEVITDGGSFEATTDKTPIPESNIGNKLLKLMGWRGGGVGAEGNKGRAEPVSVSGVVNRGGLGLSSGGGAVRDFRGKILPVIHDFLRSEREDDLAFAPDFSKQERHVIHTEAQRLGLKTRSYGKDESRFLVISRRRSARQLLEYVQSQGGETSKYKLLAPGTHPALGGAQDVVANDDGDGDDDDDSDDGT